MRGSINPLPQYAFLAWCLIKAQGQLYLFTFYSLLRRERKQRILNVTEKIIIYISVSRLKMQMQMTGISHGFIVLFYIDSLYRVPYNSSEINVNNSDRGRRLLTSIIGY
jgi:hypothetical protein